MLSKTLLLLGSIISHTCAATPSTTGPSTTSSVGYDNFPSSIPPSVSNKTFSFGQHYAVLNLDLINLLVGSVSSTPAGQSFINNTANWINAVHAQNPSPLQIFTRIYFSNSHKPEVGPDTPFAPVVSALGAGDDPKTQLYPAFKANETAGDVVLAKTRFYAGAGNALEEILRAQKIDTVILSGIRTSGVILSTAYRLFDLDYDVYVIANNTIETPPNAPAINTAILEGILPKNLVNVITIEQALAALKRSGPAQY